MSRDITKDLLEDDETQVDSIGTVSVDGEKNVLIEPVDDDELIEVCHLSELSEKDVSNPRLQEMKQGVENLRVTDDSRFDGTVYRLDVDSDGKLKLNLPNRDIVIFDFYDDKDELSCEWLLEDYDREELAEMIEYTKESEFDSHFYTNNTFEDVIVQDGDSVDYYGSEQSPKQSAESTSVEDTNNSQIHVEVGTSSLQDTTVESDTVNDTFETTVLVVFAQLIVGIQPLVIVVTALIGLSFTLLYKYLEEE